MDVRTAPNRLLDIRIIYDLWWSMIVFDDLWDVCWYVVILNCLLMTVYEDLWEFIMAYDGFWWLMIAYAGWNTQVHNCRRSRRPLNPLLGCCRSVHIFDDDDHDEDDCDDDDDDPLNPLLGCCSRSLHIFEDDNEDIHDDDDYVRGWLRGR